MAVGREKFHEEHLYFRRETSNWRQIRRKPTLFIFTLSLEQSRGRFSLLLRKPSSLKQETREFSPHKSPKFVRERKNEGCSLF
jgi:hypothetical protein